MKLGLATTSYRYPPLVLVMTLSSDPDGYDDAVLSIISTPRGHTSLCETDLEFESSEESSVVKVSKLNVILRRRRGHR